MSIKSMLVFFVMAAISTAIIYRVVSIRQVVIGA